MSLSQEPALSYLKSYFVCGYHDITGEPYAGMSGVHDNFGNAVDTSNGAGPHNIQIFMLAPDGTVLNCLPGYWSSQDLIPEMQLAAQLNRVWQDQRLSKAQKDHYFMALHMDHLKNHSQPMKNRSHMQGFDEMYEAEHNPHSDVIRNPQQVAMALAAHAHMPQNGFLRTDEILHERMAKRPFVNYQNFDVAAFSDYGKTKYDKEEDYRMADGSVDHERAAHAPELGKKGQNAAPQNDPKLWGNNNFNNQHLWGNNGWTGDH